MIDIDKNELPTLNWFPGHMVKARRIITENLKLVDVVIELLDARIPYSSANPMLQELTAGKPRLVALNKSDLADAAVTKRWLEHFRAAGIPAVAIDSMSGKGMKQLVRQTEDLARAKTEKFVSHPHISLAIVRKSGLQSLHRRTERRDAPHENQGLF